MTSPERSWRISGYGVKTATTGVLRLALGQREDFSPVIAFPEPWFCFIRESRSSLSLGKGYLKPI